MSSQPFFDDPASLSTRECLDWLPADAVAHVGATIAGLPVVVPLPYQRRGEDLFLMVSEAPSLRNALDGAIVAVSAQATDPTTGRPWSVLAIGQGSRADPGDALVEGFGSFVAGDVYLVHPQLVSARPSLQHPAR